MIAPFWIDRRRVNRPLHTDHAANGQRRFATYPHIAMT